MERRPFLYGITAASLGVLLESYFTPAVGQNSMKSEKGMAGDERFKRTTYEAGRGLHSRFLVAIAG